MCPTCEDAYRKGQFCFFCETIYFLEGGSDGKNWVGCDGCEKWLHKDCDPRLDGIKFSELEEQDYYCPKCEVPKKRKQKKAGKQVGDASKKVKTGSFFSFIQKRSQNSFQHSICRLMYQSQSKMISLLCM